MPEKVILVDKQNREIGTEEKLQAHLDGKLHRAFSVFLFNANNEMLLQKRATGKYHAGGLWTNTCCSHPRPMEKVSQAATRRLQEEMGITCKLAKAFDFIYRADMKNGLIEYEFDHVFIGTYDGKVLPNPNEVMAYKWISKSSLENELRLQPEIYTPWFKIAVNNIFKSWNGAIGLKAFKD